MLMFWQCRFVVIKYIAMKTNKIKFKILKEILFCIFATASGLAKAEEVLNIPDVNFKSYLIGNASININRDNFIQISEALAFTGTIDCSNKNILDLTGIEAFGNLGSLYCQKNKLTSLNILNLGFLKILNCSNNNLKSLDISHARFLTRLECSDNYLTNLDLFVGTGDFHNSLNYLNCSRNKIKELVVKYTPLVYLYCNSNLIQVLELSANSVTGTVLKELECASNQLKRLDITLNVNLQILNCSENPFQYNYGDTNNLNLKNSKSLRQLICKDIGFTTAIGNGSQFGLDISNNTELLVLYCGGSSLSGLDLSNQTKLKRLAVTQAQLTNLDVSKNTALEVLDCYSNKLTSLDVSKNTVLTDFYCSNNKITVLNVSKNKALKILHCDSNQLTSLDLSNNIALQSLLCFNNKIKSLDISKNTVLTLLQCFSNQFTSLNLKNGRNYALTLMQAQSNPNLTCIEVDNATNAQNYNNWIKDDIANYSVICALSVSNFNKKEISLYPNPVHDHLNFSEELSEIKITEFSGKTVKEVSGKGKSLNISNLAKGIYIISATTKAGKTINQKIIKQ